MSKPTPLYTFITELKAIDPLDNVLKSYEGPKIMAYTWLQAEITCERLYPYLTVIGKLIDEGSINDNIIIVELNLN